MKLDKRIKSRSWIFDCFNAHIAEQYIGEECYMTTALDFFDDLKRVQIYRLDSIVDESYFYNEKEDEIFDFCLPVKWVEWAESKEKKYRPYTFLEFTEKFKVGLPIKFREKGKEGCERYFILNGYQHEQRDGQTVTFIYLGSYPYTLDELFNAYEWQVHYTEDFEPFGVEE